MSEVDSLRRELTQTRARLEDVEKTADQDGMLPLLNRRAFVRELTRYIAFTGRYNTPASLIYFDLNHMKKTNDTLGHAAGRRRAGAFLRRAAGPCARQRLRRAAGRRLRPDTTRSSTLRPAAARPWPRSCGASTASSVSRRPSRRGRTAGPSASSTSRRSRR